ncbi:MAG TPA: hypothetical protein VGH23_01740 [Rhizomicrobium sp.]|jgi:hypothetical protein
MISASITGLTSLIHQLALYQLLNRHADGRSEERVSESFIDQARGWLKIASAIAKDFQIKAAMDRIELFGKALDRGLTWRDLGGQAQVLREAIDCGLREQLIYRYDENKGAVFSRWMEDWATTREKFPSAIEDIKAAVDCWALYYGTASVFHSMRVLEYGLAALAGDVGISITTQSWQNVIDQIESRVRALGKELPSGLEKSERLRFLSEAAKEMVYFKDGWRNHVSHNRATYDEYQARSVLEHVRGFMTVLSGRLSEVPLP